jgi:predicted component of type VI protein secretion system
MTPVYTLRLFHRDEPFSQIEARDLSEGALSIGRDESADWRVADESRTLSRLHCTFEVGDDHLTLRDSSINGVFVGPERRRLRQGGEAALAPGESVRLGDYIIVVEGPAGAADHVPAPVIAHPRSPCTASRPMAADSSLLESFCAGAGLDASAFSGEDPTQVMRRLGEVYQQMVQGLGGLMSERSLAKSAYQLERTTVRAGGNNPFRWATTERVAVDLLRPRDDGFLCGAAAVDMSFADLRKHLLCTAAGAQAAAAATLAALDPAAIEESLKGRGFGLKSRSSEAWSRFLEVYDQARGGGPDDPENLASRSFREAYGRQDGALGSDGTLA